MNNNEKFKKVADLIRKDKIEDVITLIKRGEVDHSLCNERKRNLLMVAVANNKSDLSRFLIGEGVKLMIVI